MMSVDSPLSAASMLHRATGRFGKICLIQLLALASSPLLADLSLQTTTDNANIKCGDEFSAATPDYDFHRSRLPRLEGRKINQVRVTRLPIFDEGNDDENNWLYRWANRVHVLTKEDHLREQLLFKPGDTYDARTTEESARLLRDLGHLYDADIHLTSLCEDTVDLEVVARDVWSLTIDTSFSRSGGENEYRFGVGETNLFGNGQKISVSSGRDDERQTTTFAYRDKNIANTRLQTSLKYQDSDDGNRYAANLSQPFYALDTKRAWGVGFDQAERIDSQYFRGKTVSEVRHEIDDVNLFYGWSKGLERGVINRWSVGYRYRHDEFSITDDLPPPARLPTEQELSYPYISYQRLEDNYTTAFNLDQINRTEDLHLGYDLRLSIGYAAKSFGSNADRFIVNGSMKDTVVHNEKVLLQHYLNFEGLVNQNTNDSEDVVVEYGVTYFRSQTSHRSFYASFNLTWSENLNSHRQILLGGDSGVRGFDRRLQSGDRRVILTLEERQYTNYHLFNLAYLGFAVFMDIGRAWSSGVSEGFADDYLASAGVGLRLASSKSDSARVVHVDLAFPLTNRDEPETEAVDLSVNIKSSL